MANRPTVQDLARESGVSVATVDRVLNRRAPVRAETQSKVYEAARKLGYRGADVLGRHLEPNVPELNLGLVFSKESQHFYRLLRLSVEKAAERFISLRIRPKFVFSPGQSPWDFASLIKEVGQGADVVAATAVDHSAVTEAVSELEAKGVACFSLMNDFAQGVRHAYIGLNNLKNGRVAGHMISLACRPPGKVAVFVGGHRWHGHALRETGFRSYLREHRADMTVLDTLVNLETRQLTYEATLNLLTREPELTGLYCAGGGMEGAIAALREMRKPNEVALVVNELTPESRGALIDRYATMVAATPLDALCDSLMASIAHRFQTGSDQPPGQVFLDPTLYLPESV